LKDLEKIDGKTLRKALRSAQKEMKEDSQEFVLFMMKLALIMGKRTERGSLSLKDDFILGFRTSEIYRRLLERKRSEKNERAYPGDH